MCNLQALRTRPARTMAGWKMAIIDEEPVMWLVAAVRKKCKTAALSISHEVPLNLHDAY